MRVNRITLVNFRSYSRLQVDLDPGMNFFVGPNGAGKTNILEALYMLGTARSPRAARDRDLITWGQDSYYVGAEVGDRASVIRLELFFHRQQGKGARINGVPQKRISDVLGHVNVVFFSPDDLSLTKGGPAVRREFLDDQICQVDPSHFRHLARYNRALQQRNGALRESAARSQVSEAFDLQFIDSGSRVIHARLEAVSAIEPGAGSWIDRLSGGADRLGLSYRTTFDLAPNWSLSAVRDALSSALRESRTEETRRGHTTVGPHRDDIHLDLNGHPARAYSSQGQQRSIALALKLQQLDYIQKRRQTMPVLLLDDVLSELDQGRRQVIMNHLPPHAQILITSTDREAVTGAQIFVVEEGSVRKEKC